ncbi:hypothetical protein DHD32_10860 [Arenibacter sp. TNZ]|uniref:hypothetical protein n=1 Tax=Arenibacter TaxID=178469 RepID=UPI000CD3B28F|nr:MULTISPECIES: hypothetical protein [Arenibacter]MCM4171982.1 hypothetical protein [Arenibacter sp. TNZ]
MLSNSRTLLEDISEAKLYGYLEEFMFTDGKLIGRVNNKSYQKDECVLIEYCIHEAMSDPSDRSILFLIECVDGTKGCLSSAYGIYADSELIDFCSSLKKKN